MELHKQLIKKQAALMDSVIKHYLTQLIVQLFNVLTIRSFSRLFSKKPHV